MVIKTLHDDILGCFNDIIYSTCNNINSESHDFIQNVTNKNLVCHAIVVNENLKKLLTIMNIIIPILTKILFIFVGKEVNLVLKKKH